MPGACDVVRWIVKDDKVSRFPSRLVFFTSSPSSHTTPVHVQFVGIGGLATSWIPLEEHKNAFHPRVSRMEWKALMPEAIGSAVRFKFRLRVGSHDLTMP